MKRSKKDHDWAETGTDILGDKDYRCSKCKVWASRTLSPWSKGGCPGKPIEEGDGMKTPDWEATDGFGRDIDTDLYWHNTGLSQASINRIKQHKREHGSESKLYDDIDKKGKTE